MTVSEHAELKRILSAESGASEPGKYHCRRAQYQKGMQDAILEPGIEEVTFMTAARLGKTTVLENILGYFVDYDPAPILMIHESDKKAKSWSKINLQPMINDNPHLKVKFAEEKSRNSDSEILYKSFQGGHLVIGGANTPTSFSSYSMRIVMFEEIDRYPVTVGQEGDPIELGKQRAENFLNRKFVEDSTPTVKDLSSIEKLWNMSDQRMYFVPCPFCGYKQILIFGARSQFAHLTNGYLKFVREGNKVKSVVYVCGNPECRKEISEKYKGRMLKEGEWRKTNPSVKDHAGFWINRLYSPWSSWKSIVENFFKCERNPEKYRVWVNTTLGETYVDNPSLEISETLLMKQREVYEKIPLGVVALTVGVDVQDDRVEVAIYGWGKNEEAWFIERAVIPGSIEDDATQKMIDAFVTRERQYENGFPSRFGQIGGVLIVCIDSGDQTKSVNSYVAERKKKRFVTVKGANKPQKVYVAYSHNKHRQTPLVIVDTFQGKKMIYHRLNIEPLKDESGTILPTPRRWHFNMTCDTEFFAQLTAERLETKKIKGYPVQAWVLPSGKRNEQLDIADYALAGLHLIVPGGPEKVEAFLDRLADIMAFRMHKYNYQNISPEAQRDSEAAAPDVIKKDGSPVPAKKRLRMKMKLGGK